MKIGKTSTSLEIKEQSGMILLGASIVIRPHTKNQTSGKKNATAYIALTIIEGGRRRRSAKQSRKKVQEVRAA